MVMIAAFDMEFFGELLLALFKTLGIKDVEGNY